VCHRWGGAWYKPGMTPLWDPSAERVADTNISRFMAAVNARWDAGVSDYPGLHRFSIDHMGQFWDSFWDFAGMIGDKGATAFVPGETMMDARFFPDARLNYAENLLRNPSDQVAVIDWTEEGPAGEITRAELADRVARLASVLRSWGLEPGDRVAAWLPASHQGFEAMLAATSLGATFTSTSPDFGVDGVVDRFGQVEPRVLLAVDAYRYNGRVHDVTEKLAAVLERLPSIEHVILVGYVDPDASLPGAHSYEQLIANAGPQPLRFERLGFDHPLYVLYSSGTTGAPKCIVHRAGGVLIKHLEEQLLQSDIRAGDRVFYFTTTGWMMWNWLVSALATEAVTVLYDGSPFHPDGHVLFDMAERTDLTLFGTSAKFIDAVAKADLRPIDRYDLTSIRTVASTGSPLSPAGFEAVYERISPTAHLASISGGTDLCGCLVAGDPTSPVWAGEIQRPVLGVAADVFDDAGATLTGEAGELVCTSPFPSQPLGFWDDPGDERYRATYYERFPGAWHQGDYARWTDHGGMVIDGRSDATLNPGGVRIGTAEIYRQVESFPEVLEGLVIGQRWDDDTRIVLFVVLAEGAGLTEDLADAIRRRVREHTTPRHVPARILTVPALPKTRSGKIVELAVSDVVHGRPVKNLNALDNPDALADFTDRPELQ